MVKLVKKMISEVIKTTAFASSETTSIMFTYEPKVPQQLIDKKDNMNQTLDNV